MINENITKLKRENADNINMKVSSFESNENTRPYCAISDHESSSMTINELAMNARRLHCNFVD